MNKIWVLGEECEKLPGFVRFEPHFLQSELLLLLDTSHIQQNIESNEGGCFFFL